MSIYFTANGAQLKYLRIVISVTVINNDYKLRSFILEGKYDENTKTVKLTEYRS